MKFQLVKPIFIFTGFLLFFVFFGCTSTQNKTHIIEAATGKTAFSFVPDQPDSSMKKLPQRVSKLRFSNPDEFIRRFAAYAARRSKNDFELVKKIHDWIALNIKYDAESFYSGNTPAQYYENTLMSGMAVCDGYSTLFKRICDELKIECVKISGYGRGAGSDVFLPDFWLNSNHAWNMVKLDSNWYLIDCTWDAGYVERRQAVQSYKTDYLFTKPEIMIYTHFPEKPEYQLIDPPVTRPVFLEMPRYSPLFFKYMTEVPSNLKKITEIEGRIKMKLLIKNDTFLMFDVLDMFGREIPNGNEIGRLLKNGKSYEGDFIFTQEGNYIIRLYASTERYGTYESVVEYGIITTSYIPTPQDEAMRAINDSLRYDIMNPIIDNTPQREEDYKREHRETQEYFNRNMR